MRSLLKRIHIIGPVGSGKSTLAETLSNDLKLPHYPLDNIVWDRLPSGAIRRDISIRNLLLEDVVEKREWIIEGTQHKWVEPSLKKADKILLLDYPFALREEWINHRFQEQLSKKINGPYLPTKELLAQMHQWNKDYENFERTNILNKLRKHHQKVIIFQEPIEINSIKRYLAQ